MLRTRKKIDEYKGRWLITLTEITSEDVQTPRDVISMNIIFVMDPIVEILYVFLAYDLASVVDECLTDSHDGRSPRQDSKKVCMT